MKQQEKKKKTNAAFYKMSEFGGIANHRIIHWVNNFY